VTEQPAGGDGNEPETPFEQDCKARRAGGRGFIHADNYAKKK
jgi:hypothetical protein